MEAQFDKVTFISRPHFMDDGQPNPNAWSPIAYSAKDCVANQWQGKDAKGEAIMVCSAIMKRVCA